jgi:hypothetical protein
LAKLRKQPKWSRKEREASIEELRALEEAQARRLDALNRDQVFRRETERIKRDLTELREDKPALFLSCFKGFTYGLISDLASSRRG